MQLRNLRGLVVPLLWQLFYICRSVLVLLHDLYVAPAYASIKHAEFGNYVAVVKQVLGSGKKPATTNFRLVLNMSSATEFVMSSATGSANELKRNFFCLDDLCIFRVTSGFVEFVASLFVCLF